MGTRVHKPVTPAEMKTLSVFGQKLITEFHTASNAGDVLTRHGLNGARSLTFSSVCSEWCDSLLPAESSLLQPPFDHLPLAPTHELVGLASCQ